MLSVGQQRHAAVSILFAAANTSASIIYSCVVLKCTAYDNECLGAWVNFSNLVSQGKHNSKSRAGGQKQCQINSKKNSIHLVFLGEGVLDTFNTEHAYNFPAGTASSGLSLQVC